MIFGLLSSPSDPWFDPNVTGVWLGALGGSLVGVLGAFVGVAGGYLVPKGKGRSLVLGVLGAEAALGALFLIAGVLAVTLGQPYGVWYPMVLVGGLAAGLGGGFLPVMAKRYRQAENRRIDAEALRNG